MLGNSFLIIPIIFSRTGWLGGLILFAVVGILNTYSMAMLINVT
jgi:hypothetical protein